MARWPHRWRRSATASATSRRCSTSHGRGTRCARSPRCAAASRWPATMPNVACSRRAVERKTAAHRHARRPSGRARRRVLARVPARRVARHDRGGRGRRPRAPALALADAGRQTTHRQTMCAGAERGSRVLRRRRLRRRHWLATAVARRAGAADLGRHHQRAVARSAARGRPQARSLAHRARAHAAVRQHRRIASSLRSPATPETRLVRRRGGWSKPPGAIRSISRRGRDALPSPSGRALELSLLASHADWCLRSHGDPASKYAAQRLRAHGIDALSRGQSREHAHAMLYST